MKDKIQELQKCLTDLVADEQLLQNCEKVAKLTIHALKKGHRVYFFGNGGSAADAQHLAAELMGKFNFDREPLPAMSLNTNVSVLTAVANDYSYDRVFARQVSGLVQAGDICFGLSTSGNSPNVVKALEVANNKKAITVAICGNEFCNIQKIANICLSLPSNNTPRVQEMTILIGHTICEIVEKELFLKY